MDNQNNNVNPETENNVNPVIESNVNNNVESTGETKKGLVLPLKILIIGIVIGLLFAGFGLFKQIETQKINKLRYEEAYAKALKNKEKLEKKYAENKKTLEKLKNDYVAKEKECSSLQMSDPDWYAKKIECVREKSDIDDEMNKVEREQFQIEHYDNTVFYEKLKPMTYLIFYIIGGAIAGLAALAAFIIYLVKGKKTY